MSRFTLLLVVTPEPDGNTWISVMLCPHRHKYFLKVLAVMLILIANMIANGSTI